MQLVAIEIRQGDTARVRAKLTAKDKRTMQHLVGLADTVVSAARRARDPHMDIPTRSLSNVRYNRRKRFIEMGRNTNRRQLFNLSQAKVLAALKGANQETGGSVLELGEAEYVVRASGYLVP